MSKYYKIIKDHPLWDIGAILEWDASSRHYVPVSDLWSKEISGMDGVSAYGDGKELVENQKEWYQRVYEVSVLGKVKYLAKDAARDAYAKLHKEDK